MPGKQHTLQSAAAALAAGATSMRPCLPSTRACPPAMQGMQASLPPSMMPAETLSLGSLPDDLLVLVFGTLSLQER